MATLGDLKKRIISETLRDDLADTMAADLTLIIQRSIEYYANERWWFNEAGASITLASGIASNPLPPDFRFLDQAWLQVGATQWPLRLLQAVEIDDLFASSTSAAQPTDCAIVQSSFYVWPRPNMTYAVKLRYVQDVQPVLDYTVDTGSNLWTNTGQDLIVAQSKIRLFRDYLSSGTQDPRLANAVDQEAQAYVRLRSETNKRISTGRVRAGW